ncbi:hypothetical protein L917_09821 [Phytophthora nicotianae]|uniref:Uncharacterized protein n=3 Tax=Phytophthora nicotianae TaxID=4792 RepID=V9F0R6_PHYNI|nr:hypothetical protein F443_10217 [Phytophthora nicotianae P1569]ETK85101.1 hypothetical protein L915_09995 [Phytophthora nicotianae]ETL91647.1 hypothetical protein L917_09821 [Phytophthora nicotianae]ETM44938.1 hypothetical protein L914_09876 [Phytophthora nicotianae]
MVQESWEHRFRSKRSDKFPAGSPPVLHCIPFRLHTLQYLLLSVSGPSHNLTRVGRNAEKSELQQKHTGL